MMICVAFQLGCVSEKTQLVAGSFTSVTQIHLKLHRGGAVEQDDERADPGSRRGPEHGQPTVRAAIASSQLAWVSKILSSWET